MTSMRTPATPVKSNFHSTEEISAAIDELRVLLIKAKQDGVISNNRYDHLNQQLKGISVVAGEAVRAKGLIEYAEKQADKYARLVTTLIMQHSAKDSEDQRALLSDLIADLARANPNDHNLRSLHENIMRTNPNTNKFIWKVADLENVINYAVNKGLAHECKLRQIRFENQSRIEKTKEEANIQVFNEHFPATKDAMITQLKAAHDKKNKKLETEAERILTDNLQEAKTYFDSLISEKEINVKALVRYSTVIPRDKRNLIIQRLNQFSKDLQENSPENAITTAKALINTCRGTRLVTLGDGIKIANAIQFSMEMYVYALEQRQKYNAGQIKPSEIINNNFATKSKDVMDQANDHEKFFTAYAEKNKNAFRTYTAEKGQLAEKCADFIKGVKDKMTQGEYKSKDDIQHDLQKMQALKDEYQQILVKGQSSIFFRAKGTGEFATHMRDQFDSLKKTLESLQTALENKNKLRMK